MNLRKYEASRNIVHCLPRMIDFAPEGQWTNLGAIYNPVTNTWTSVNPPSSPTLWANIGDAEAIGVNATEILPLRRESRQPTRLEEWEVAYHVVILNALAWIGRRMAATDSKIQGGAWPNCVGDGQLTLRLLSRSGVRTSGPESHAARWGHASLVRLRFA